MSYLKEFAAIAQLSLPFFPPAVRNSKQHPHKPGTILFIAGVTNK